jgi:putative ABC transport system permease protein
MVERLFRRLRTLANRNRVKDDISREIDFHITMETELRQRRGMDPGEARRTALRDFGGVGRHREAVHDTRGMTYWDSLTQDVRFAWRTLRRWPGYTIGTIATLALGIGANTAIFSIVNNVLLEPLPYRSAGELVRVVQSRVRPVPSEAGVSIKELQEYRETVKALDGLVEYHRMTFILLNQGEPDEVNTGVVSSNYFDMLGIAPLHGRTFNDKDDDLGAEPVVLLSHGYWKSKFGGDVSIVGRPVEMNDKQHVIIGVLPPVPQYPHQNEVYMPTSACPFRASSEPLAAQNRRAFGSLRVFGRLKSGEKVESATAEVLGITQRWGKDHPQFYRQDVTQFSGRVVSINEEIVRDARPILLALLATTTLVLLIACANVANLSLSRMARRDREIAVRVALGAGRRRLLRQLLTESSMLALGGGILGLVLAWASIDMLAVFASRFTPRVIDPSIDVTVLLFTLGVSIATGLLFGIVPAISSRPSLTSSLKEGGAQTGDGTRGRRVRGYLVVAQVTVCFALLVGAGLFIDSLRRLASVDLGYQSDRVLTAAVSTDWSRHREADHFRRFYTTMLDRLRSTPGVISAAVTNGVPLSNIAPGPRPMRIEGRAGDDITQLPVADQRVGSDGYFETLGVKPLRGRTFTASDTQDGLPVAVINQTMARLWGERDPIGGRFQFALGPRPPGAQGPPPSNPWLTVVGVVSDMRQFAVDQEAPAQFYTPFLQTPQIGGQVLVRTDGEPMTFVPQLKAAVYAADPQVAIENIESLESLRYERLASPSLNATLLGIFAGLALLITLAGLTAVIGTSVSQRTREFGVRMALGASRASVLIMVLRQGLILVAIGLVGGAVAAAVFGRSIATYLYKTTPTDPAVYAAVAAVFLVAATFACLGPARRATSIDPLLALKAE